MLDAGTCVLLISSNTAEVMPYILISGDTAEVVPYILTGGDTAEVVPYILIGGDTAEVVPYIQERLIVFCFFSTSEPNLGDGGGVHLVFRSALSCTCGLKVTACSFCFR